MVVGKWTGWCSCAFPSTGWHGKFAADPFLICSLYRGPTVFLFLFLFKRVEDLRTLVNAKVKPNVDCGEGLKFSVRLPDSSKLELTLAVQSSSMVIAS